MVAMKVLVKIGMAVALACVGSHLFHSDVTPNHTKACRGCGPGVNIKTSASHDMPIGTAEINWTLRSKYKAGVIAAGKAKQFRSSKPPNVKFKEKHVTIATQDVQKRLSPMASIVRKPFDNTFIITLRRDEIRVAHVQDIATNVLFGSSIVWAIDGRNISDAQIASWQREGYLTPRLSGFMNPSKPVGKPKIACLMSHVRLWERLVESDAPESGFYFILEDDIQPAPDFSTRYAGVLHELDDLTWDWVYLAIHPTWASKNTLTIPGKALINRAPRMVGNAGYLISKRGARKVLKNLFPCGIPKDQAIRILVERGELEAYIVKTELIGVLGQQGQGFADSLAHDSKRIFKSNIWDK